MADDPHDFHAHVQQRLERLRGELAAQFPTPTELTLEIGCGHGHYLTAYAKAFPEQSCLGLDIMRSRIRRAEIKARRAGLANLHFLTAEANEFLACLPTHVALRRTLILFNDPWPKQRHHKNRLPQPEFLHRLAGLSPTGAQLYFRTDHAGFFAWTLKRIEAHSCWKLDPVMPWCFEAPSIFQEYAPGYQSFVATRTDCPAEPAPLRLLEAIEQYRLRRQHEEGEDAADEGMDVDLEHG